MNHIFEQIAAERKRQDEKWGERNLPMLRRDSDLTTVKVYLKEYKRVNALDALSKDTNWMRIFLEKIYDAFAETDPVKSREEMVQVAAVAVQIIEYLDRQIDGGKGC